MLFNPSSTFVTSDHHFGHKNIIHLCHRPFDSLYQMDEYMISQWNSVVGQNDTVIHLGDLFFKGGKGYCRAIRARLNGNILLIAGNHDKNRTFSLVDAVVFDSLRLTISGVPVLLRHYPVRMSKEPDLYQKYDYFLVGHVHSNEGLIIEKKNINMSVEHHDYKPVSLGEALYLANKR